MATADIRQDRAPRALLRWALPNIQDCHDWLVHNAPPRRRLHTALCHIHASNTSAGAHFGQSRARIDPHSRRAPRARGSTFVGPDSLLAQHLLAQRGVASDQHHHLVELLDRETRILDRADHLRLGPLPQFHGHLIAVGLLYLG